MQAVPDWLYRGFTGHEHVAVFALINMNGRMYDPMTGQMMAPDNYIPMPWSPGGYNRYNYANSNPLKFIDPDGEWIQFVIGAIVGGVINVATNWAAIKNGDVLTGVGYFLVGAASGAVGAGTGSFAAAGAIMGAGNSALSGGDLLQIGVGAVVGAASGAVGGSVGNAVSKGLSSINVGGLVNGFVSGAAGGFMGGVTAGVTSHTANYVSAGISNKSFGNFSFGDMIKTSIDYGVRGAAMGAAFGGAAKGAEAYVQGKNIWTGRPVAPGRGQFALSNVPVRNGYELLYLNQYNANNEIVKTDFAWAKDVKTKGSLTPQYEIDGVSPQRFWNIVTNGNGAPIESMNLRYGYSTSYQGNNYTYRYYISSSGSLPTITLYINSFEAVKYRFPFYK